MSNDAVLTFNLSLDELNAVLNLLGELPTKTGIYPVLIKLKLQAEEQLQGDAVA
jgi:ABC-type sulfate transport system permease component